ncbi:MAG: NAD(P)/FAD-dependent oxidoreductase [Candidatus Eremiobacteraeota bacterium]|nr:NAD(P)/FAD-dependent oxidoreductase [Candidatus Eremiobacteraeota bacterium]
MAHRAVILGGGFGGLAAAQKLGQSDLDVTLIDRRNFHLFQPLMYQVATGSLSPGEIAAPLRSVLNRDRNVTVLLGEADDIDPAARVVHLKDGASIPYDSLVIATGADGSYFGHDAWSQFAPYPKTLEEAIAIRSKIFFAFEAAERARDPQEVKAWLTFIVVGAGPTGLEMAGALGEIARQTLRRDFRHIHPQESRIVLMDAADRVLPGYPPDLSAKAAQLVGRLGVEVMTGCLVRDISAQSITYEAAGVSHQIATRTVMWAGGITATAFGRRVAERTHARTDKAGRIFANPDLTIPSFSDIYVIGDLGLCMRPNGTPLPGVAQVAMQQGAYAAKAVRARSTGATAVPPFRYFDKGDIAVIGRAAAVANIFGIHLWGLPAWIVWLFVHLLYLVQFQSRLLVFIEWGFLYLTYSRGARLIAGGEASAMEID